jgi:hypothetical protein
MEQVDDPYGGRDDRERREDEQEGLPGIHVERPAHAVELWVGSRFPQPPEHDGGADESNRDRDPGRQSQLEGEPGARRIDDQEGVKESIDAAPEPLFPLINRPLEAERALLRIQAPGLGLPAEPLNRAL